MANIPAIEVTEVLGHTTNNEKTHAILGLKAGDTELPIALTYEHLLQVISSLVDATAAFPLQKGMMPKGVQAFQPDWFEFGIAAGTGDYALSLFLPSKGHLTFQMNRPMTERLREALEQALTGAATNPPPGTTRQ